MLRAAIITLLLTTVSIAQTTRPMVRSAGQWHFKGDKDAPTDGAYVAFTLAGWDGKSPLPLLIFLHGAGYRGQDPSLLDKEFLVQQIADGRTFEAIVLFPQVTTYWRGDQAAAFIDQAMKDFAGRYDADRVYLMGESSGGGGCWEGAKLRADVLAAAVPIATTIGRAEGADALAKLPIWAFHNVNDPYQLVEKSRTQVNAIRAAGGKYVFLTEYTTKPGKPRDGKYPNAHRHAWETALSDPAMWDWLWRQRRGKPQLAVDPAPSTQRAQ